MAEQEFNQNGEDTADATASTETTQAEKADNTSETSALQEQVGELKDKYLRLFAEFDNYKKRTNREYLELRNTAAQDTLSALLPVLDDFDRAKANAEKPDSTEPFSEGIHLVYQKLQHVLQNKGLKPMEVQPGDAFDPELHEAITRIPAPTPELKGKIIDTIEKGYFLSDKIIRFAKVVVGD